MKNVLFLFGSAFHPNIDYSHVEGWHPLVFMGVCMIILLTAVIPAILSIVGMVIRSNKEHVAAQAKIHQTQMDAMSKSYQCQNAGLMEHQKEQIVRICDSHVNSFDKTVSAFEQSLEKRDREQAAIMGELRVINDKVDAVSEKVTAHITEKH